MRTPAKISDANLARTVFLRKKNKKLRCVLCPRSEFKDGAVNTSALKRHLQQDHKGLWKELQGFQQRNNSAPSFALWKEMRGWRDKLHAKELERSTRERLNPQRSARTKGNDSKRREITVPYFHASLPAYHSRCWIMICVRCCIANSRIVAVRSINRAIAAGLSAQNQHPQKFKLWKVQ